MSPTVATILAISAAGVAVLLAIVVVVLLWTRRDSLIPQLIAQKAEALARERTAITEKGEVAAERDTHKKAATAQTARAEAAEKALHALRVRRVAGLSGDALGDELDRVLSEAGHPVAVPAGPDPGPAPPKLLDPWPDAPTSPGGQPPGDDPGRLPPHHG